MIRSLFNALLDFAESKFAECDCAGYATGRSAVRSGYDETAEAIALGGSSLAQEFRGHRTGARPTDLKFPVRHSRGDTL